MGQKGVKGYTCTMGGIRRMEQVPYQYAEGLAKNSRQYPTQTANITLAPTLTQTLTLSHIYLTEPEPHFTK